MELVSLSTAFQPASGGAAMGEEDPFGGGGRTPMGPGGTQSADAGVPAQARGKAHVRVTSTFTVAATNLERFMLEIVEPQIRAMAEREHTRYDVVVGQVPWAAQGAGADPFGGPGGQFDTRGGFQTPGGPTRTTRTYQPGSGSASGGDPNQLAPLPPPPTPRGNLRTVTITWFAVLDSGTEGGDL
jgi:hypothetical protein